MTEFNCSAFRCGSLGGKAEAMNSASASFRERSSRAVLPHTLSMEKVYEIHKYSVLYTSVDCPSMVTASMNGFRH